MTKPNAYTEQQAFDEYYYTKMLEQMELTNALLLQMIQPKRTRKVEKTNDEQRQSDLERESITDEE